MKAERETVDIVFANGGVGSQLRLGESTAKHIDKTFDVNVKGTIFTVQKALPLMGKACSIILAGSSAGTTGALAFTVYCASNAALFASATNRASPETIPPYVWPDNCNATPRAAAKWAFRGWCRMTGTRCQTTRKSINGSGLDLDDRKWHRRQCRHRWLDVQSEPSRRRSSAKHP